MIQYLAGDMNQVMMTEMGEFIDILGVRVRKALIMVYMLGGPIPPKEEGGEELWSVNFMVGGGWNSTRAFPKEICEDEINRLDWVYRKEYGRTNADSGSDAVPQRDGDGAVHDLVPSDDRGSL